jgi:hypothetical protein
MAQLGEDAEVKTAVQLVRTRVLDGAVLVFAGGLLTSQLVNEEMIWKIAEVRPVARRAAASAATSSPARRTATVACARARAQH